MAKKIKAKLDILTAKYVLASDIFFGCRNVWEEFENSDKDCDYGNNNRTLMSKDFMLAAIDNLEGIDDGDDDENNKFDADCEFVKSRLMALDNDVYIDLEN